MINAEGEGGNSQIQLPRPAGHPLYKQRGSGLRCGCREYLHSPSVYRGSTPQGGGS